MYKILLCRYSYRYRKIAVVIVYYQHIICKERVGKSTLLEFKFDGSNMII
jgi:hypothetical protein